MSATIQELERKLSVLKKQVTAKDQALRDRNHQIDAMAWVWCSGGCPGGVFRHTPEDLTEEMVQTAEHNVLRMRSWQKNAAFRETWRAMSPEEQKAWFAERQTQKKGEG